MSDKIEGTKPKKLKLNNSAMEEIEEMIKEIKTSVKNLNPVINKDIYKPIPNVKAILATIKNPKNISKTILKLNEKIPLNNLQHLKRVAKGEIIICPKDFLNGDTIQDFLKSKIEGIEDVLENFKEKDVPSLPPKIKKQFNESNKIWPCNFHPNKYYEDLLSGNFFNETDLKLHKTYMEMALEVAKYYTNKFNDETIKFDDINACIVVDPDLEAVVAVAFDNSLKHPVQHAAMLAIDNVAKTQNGGAWMQAGELNISVINRGINQKLLEDLRKKFPNQKFGAKPFKSKRNMTEDEAKDGTDLGPYLCTNYSVYMIKEPCIMCAMALVHARARRVFFCLDNEKCGGVKSKAMLQAVSSLNHHFEVFTGFL